MAVYVLTIAGATKSMRLGSLSIQETANGRNTLTCDVVSTDGSYRPAMGAEVILTEDGTRIFGGTIDTPAEAWVGNKGWAGITTRISVVDFNALADRRYVNGTVPAGTLKSQLEWADNYLTDYGVTLDVAQATGPTLAAIPCDYTQLSALLTQLSALTNGDYTWEVDYNKTLRMAAVASTAAPFNVVPASDSNAIGDITVEPSRGDYANRIILRFTSAARGAYGYLNATANFGNGETVTLGGTTYTLLTVLVDSANNVLIGADTDASLNNLIAAITAGAGAGSTYGTGTTANSSATAHWLRSGMMVAGALTAGSAGNSTAVSETCANASWITEGGGGIATLVLGADEALTNTVQSNDVAEQAAQGLWEKVIAEPDVLDATIAQAIADAYLAQAIATPKTVQYVTLQTGVHPGQVQTITVPERNLSGSFVVTDVAIYVFENQARRKVTAMGGSALGHRWQDDAKRLFSGTSGGSGGVSVTINTGSGTSGSGTANTLAKWTSSTSAVLGNSVLSESDGLVQVSHASEPGYQWYRSGSGVDHKFWRVVTGATTWSLQTVNDAYTSAANGLVVTRSGNTVTGATVTGTLTATTFSGSGASLTSLPANQLSSGIIPDARMPNLTGDVTTVEGAVATTLATVNANVGSFGSSTAIPTVTVNAKGLVTAAGTVTPQLTLTSTYFSSLSGANLTGVPTSALTGTLAAAQFPALTGDVTTVAGAIATTLATVNANVGSFGSSTAIPSFTVNGKGLITAASTNAVVAPAGTLTGTTLAATVVTSSLTTVGALNAGSIASGFGAIDIGADALTAGAGTFGAAVTIVSGAAAGTVLTVTKDDVADTGIGLLVRSSRTASSAYTLLQAVSDYDGTPVTQFTVRGDGLLTVAANAAHVLGTSGAGTAINGLNIRSQGDGAGGAGGAYVQFYRNATAVGLVGGRSAVIGATSPDAMVLYGALADGVEIVAKHASGDVRLYSRNALAATWGASQALTLTGALGGTSATFTGLASLNGGIAVDTDKFTVADGTGNTVVAGTLGVTGISTLTGLLNVNGGLAVDTDKLTIGDGTGNLDTQGYVGSSGFASQTTGWRATAAGAVDARYLFVDEMHAKSFIADLEMALAGGQIITKSVAMVGAAFTVPAAGAAATLTVRDLPSAADMAAFESGDTVVVRSFSRALGALTIAECVGVVTLYADAADGLQTWTFTRNTAGNAGTMAGGTVIAVDSLALDYGVTGNGYYEVNAIDGAYGVNSPYAQVVTWATSPVAANRTVRARFGKLTGITGTADEFGLLAGTYAASDGSFFRASNSAFDLHGITARWWDGATNVITIAPNAGAPYIGLGNPAPSAFGANAGIFLGWTTGNVAAFSAYADANNYLQYNGAVLTWKAANTTLDASGNLTATSATLSGAITATSGAIGGWSVGADYIRDAAGTVGMSSAVTAGDDIRFWAGHATMASAPFRVTEAGVLTATSGTVGGWTLAATTLTGGAAILAASGNLTLGTTNDVARLSADDATYRLWVGHATAASGPFRVTKAGALTATSATITGAITATSGAIGGWVVTSDAMKDAAGTVGLSSAVTAGDDIRFWAGHATMASAPFRVTEAGALVATSATITGAITATSGTVGSFTIGTYLYTGSKTAYNDANAGVHLGSDGIGIGNNVFTVSAAGALVATSATISGAITATSGTITGAFTVGTSGSLASGATAFDTGTGFWMDYNGGTPRFRIGNPSAQNMSWNGSTLALSASSVSVYPSLDTVNSMILNGSGLTTADSNGLDIKATGSANVRIYAADELAATFIGSTSVAGSKVAVPTVDITGGSPGPSVQVGRNSDATTPAAGTLLLTARDGTAYYLWVDATGDLRIYTSAPGSSASDTAGTVVGTQT